MKLEGARAHPIQGLHLDRAGPEGGREELLGGGAGAGASGLGGGAVTSPVSPARQRHAATMQGTAQAVGLNEPVSVP